MSAKIKYLGVTAIFFSSGLPCSDLHSDTGTRYRLRFGCRFGECAVGDTYGETFALPIGPNGVQKATSFPAPDFLLVVFSTGG
jgi:hypothetical protein